MSRFNIVLPYTLTHEGGKADNKNDPGGRTNQGVIQRTFNSWLATQGKPNRDVFTMRDAERDAIYRTLYWDVIMGDRLPAGLDLAIFDGAVNSGPRQAVKWLQRALGRTYTGSIDGVIGNLTLAAIDNYGDIAQLINAVQDRRIAFLQALKTYQYFGRGWERRVSDVRKDALAMARGQQPVVIAQTTSDANQKARIEDAKDLPSATAGNATAATGGSNIGVAVAVQTTKDALEPYVGVSDYIQWLVIILIVSGLVLTVGGFVWRTFANRKAKKLIDDLNLLEQPEANNARVA